MQTNEFEKGYSDYIDGREYEKAQEGLFQLVRISYTAGWLAAGGEAPTENKIFKAVHGGKTDRTNPQVTDEKPEQE